MVTLTGNEVIHRINQKWENGEIAIGDYIKVLTVLETTANMKNKAEDLHREADKLINDALAMKQDIIDEYSL